MKNTVATIQKMKQDGIPITEITCYDYTTAKLVEASGMNAILVGDSLGMTMLGYPDTLQVTLEDIIRASSAVTRACSDTFVIMDMPFMSYQVSVEQAVQNAGRLMKEGHGNAVKLEGGVRMADRIKAITDCGIPVQAHIGMTPQSVNAYGGFKVQGKGEAAARQVLEDALAVEAAGAFSVVLECVPPKLAALITKKLSIPTIGIGAGAGCSGQVLVYQDMLGMDVSEHAFQPKFVKRFAEVGQLMVSAFRDYINEVQSGAFPTEAHSFPKSDCSDAFLAQLDQETKERKDVL